MLRTLCFLAALWGFYGCSQQPAVPSPATGSAPPAADASPYLLATEPAGAHGVIEARQHAADADEVVITGRIGGAARPWVEGQATFIIADASLTPCNEIEGDSCPMPWDYCCEANLKNAKATVKIVDANGQTVPVDARQLLGVAELATVVVQGRAQRDAAGNLTVLASGVYVKP